MTRSCRALLGLLALSLAVCVGTGALLLGAGLDGIGAAVRQRGYGIRMFYKAREGAGNNSTLRGRAH